MASIFVFTGDSKTQNGYKFCDLETRGFPMSKYACTGSTYVFFKV